MRLKTNEIYLGFIEENRKKGPLNKLPPVRIELTTPSLRD